MVNNSEDLNLLFWSLDSCIGFLERAEFNIKDPKEHERIFLTESWVIKSHLNRAKKARRHIIDLSIEHGIRINNFFYEGKFPKKDSSYE